MEQPSSPHIQRERALAFDLNAFTRATRKRPECRKLVVMVEEATALMSATEDLKRSANSLSALSRLDAIFAESDLDITVLAADEAAIGAALFAQAVMAYARATIGPGPRKHIPTRDLPEELRAAHSRMEIVRNQVFAHYVHSNKVPHGTWLKERLVLLKRKDSFAMTLPWTMASYLGKSARDLQFLLEYLLTKCQQEIVQQGHLINEALSSLLIQFPDLTGKLAEATFDPKTIYEDKADAERFLTDDPINPHFWRPGLRERR